MVVTLLIHLAVNMELTAYQWIKKGNIKDWISGQMALAGRLERRQCDHAGK